MVDDNAALLAGTARILRQAGFEVSEAADGTSALRLLGEHAPHLVLLDVELPDISGLEVLQRIKADPSQATVMVVMLSAHQRLSEVQAAALNQGADGYLVRPLPRDELVARVRAQMRQGLMSAEQLRASETRYRQIVETAQEGIWIVGTDGCTSFANRRLEEWLDCEPAGLLGRQLAEFWEGPLPPALDAGGVWLTPLSADRLEGRLRRLGGATLPVSVTVQTMRSETVEVLGRLLMVTDLSAEAAVRDRLRLLESAVERLNDIVVITEAEPLDEPGPRMVFVNDAFTRITGYTREQALGRSPRMLQSEHTDRAELDRLRQALQQHQSLRCELSNRHAAGHEVWIEMAIEPLFDANGRCTHFVSVQRDVTERRRLEDERRALLRRLELAVAGSGIGVWDLDIGSGQVVWDSGMYRIHGLPAGDGVEPYAAWRDAVLPEDLPAAESLLQRAVAGESDFDTEFRIRRPDGAVRVVQAVARRLDDAQGRPLRMIGTNLDVTEQRQAQAALQAQRVAEQANHAKSEFMARMSHELRTPLSAVLGFSDLLRNTDDAVPLAQRRLQAERIHAAGEHLLALITDLLDVSRIEAGQMRVQLQTLDARALGLRLLAQFQAEAALRGARLALDAPAGPCWVSADPTRLHQVLQNLMSNALKYGGQGGQVTLRVQADGTGRELMVEDNGPGLSVQQQQHLFEPFNRLGREHGDVEGTGIGLVIARQLVELMNGELRVSSQPGKGSRFTVVLPQDSDPGCAVDTVREPVATGKCRSWEHTASRPATVLYVDDDPVNRELMAAMLAGQAAVALSLAPDAASALALARQQPPDLLLLDMMLPGITGIQLLASLRSLPGLKQVPALAVTANAMPEDVAQALSSGFDAYLTKPLDRGRLLGTLEQFMPTGEWKAEAPPAGPRRDSDA